MTKSGKDHPDDRPVVARPVATLWQLAWNNDRLFCTVYRNNEGLQLRVESPSAVILSEPLKLEPRTFARTQALRASLKRRGWQDSTPRTPHHP